MMQRLGLTACALTVGALVLIPPTMAKDIQTPVGYPSVPLKQVFVQLSQLPVDLVSRYPAITLIGVFVAGLLIGNFIKR